MPFDGFRLDAALRAMGRADHAAEAGRVHVACIEPAMQPAAQPEHFRCADRLVCVIGASAGGALLGLALGFSLGVLPLWSYLAFTAPIFTLALYFAVRSGVDAGAANDSWAIMAAALHLAIVAAWPIAFALIWSTQPALWLLPAAAICAATLFALIWRNSDRTIYRTAAQGALIAAVAVHGGLIMLVGA